MKTEPDVFSLADLERDRTTWWEGVRNYRARNYMTKEMSVGDEVLFYHSSTDPAGVAGLAQVTAAAEPDKSQFDKKSEYFEPKSTRENPRWFCVQVGFVSKFKNFVSLAEIHQQKPLAKMGVIKRGNRLSIQPVTKAEFEYIKKLGEK